ncbi:MAG: hypothetical protein SH817_10365 [Leptospira sp.]|nr:hypothetical protein [Leptospira sp.]
MNGQTQAVPQRSAHKKIQSEISRLQKAGGIPTELTSVVKLTDGQRTFSFFNGEEDRNNYGHLAYYRKGGKNPIESQKGKLVGFQFEIHGPDFATLNFAGTTGSYDVLDAANKLIQLTRFKITKNKTVLREGSIRSLIDPLPKVLKPFLLGTGTVNGHVPVAAIIDQGGNIEERNSNKRALYLPIDFQDNDSLVIEAWIPAGATGVATPLVNHLLTLNALGVEFPK